MNIPVGWHAHVFMGMEFLRSLPSPVALPRIGTERYKTARTGKLASLGAIALEPTAVASFGANHGGFVWSGARDNWI